MPILNNKYQIIQEIGGGSFSKIYKCSYNNMLYAIKEDANYKILKHEANIYKELRSIINLPKTIDFFTYNNKYYLVLDLFEYNMVKFKIYYYNNKDYHIKLLKIFKTIVKTVNDIHKFGIVHRDLKPTNICFDKNFEPYIIDFGLSKKIIHNKDHIEFNSINNIIGSYNFSSLNVINLIEPTRRDDFESIIFIYIYMIFNNDQYIQYDNLNINLKKDLNYIYNLLLTLEIENNILSRIYNSLLYIRRLNFKQNINYDLFYNKFFYY